MGILRVASSVTRGESSGDEEGDEEEKDASRSLSVTVHKGRIKHRSPASLPSKITNNAPRAAPLLSAGNGRDSSASASVIHAPWFAAVLAVACVSFVLILVLLFCWCARHRWTQSSAGTVIPSAPGAPPEGGLPLPDIPSPSLRISHVQPTVRRSRKGLYASRRGSNVSLTLSLPQSFDSSTSDLGHGEEQGSGLSIEMLTAQETTPSQHAYDLAWLETASRYRTQDEITDIVKHNESYLFKEFWEIPMNYASKIDIPIAGIAAKNRYQTILPNNDTRVVLPEINGDPLTTYINANHIKGFDRTSSAFIATQAPMAHTVIDFWRMVWHSNAAGIVMITRLVEQGKSKCENYLPRDNDCEAFGPIHVCVNSTVEYEETSVRQLVLRCNEEERVCQHIWFTGWPDHTTPKSTEPLLRVIHLVSKLRRKHPSQPVVIHCSAGLGRTGAFLALYFGCEQLRTDDRCDPLGVVCRLRLDRGGLVQSNEQYEFIHTCLASYRPPTPSPTRSLTHQFSLHSPTPMTPRTSMAFEFPSAEPEEDSS